MHFLYKIFLFFSTTLDIYSPHTTMSMAKTKVTVIDLSINRRVKKGLEEMCQAEEGTGPNLQGESKSKDGLPSLKSGEETSEGPR